MLIFFVVCILFSQSTYSIIIICYVECPTLCKVQGTIHTSCNRFSIYLTSCNVVIIITQYCIRYQNIHFERITFGSI